MSGPDGRTLAVGPGQPLVLIAGPCVIEERSLTLGIARTLRDACAASGVSYIFKASYDKANRTSGASARGPGLADGLSLLAEVRESLGVPVTTDIHLPDQAEAAAEVVDLIQIPAFLCRQTDLLLSAGRAAAKMGRAVNVKKGQFLAPEEMSGPVNKLVGSGCREIMLTERGTFFGYHRLVNDFIGMGDLMESTFDGGVRPPVCFDCTHSAQLPGAQGHATGGRRDRVPLLARAAVAAGVDAVFMECHPEPEKARSDASTMLRLDDAPGLITMLSRLHASVRG
ncbi:MAG: 3-deoxy-8-phosphooctulonate synthase [Phycisphaerae bacterium]|nr:3-deoxy-8-phosphooctulonate synthase [Phycisphaerae bacterium]